MKTIRRVVRSTGMPNYVCPLTAFARTKVPLLKLWENQDKSIALAYTLELSLQVSLCLSKHVINLLRDNNMSNATQRPRGLLLDGVEYLNSVLRIYRSTLIGINYT